MQAAPKKTSRLRGKLQRFLSQLQDSKAAATLLLAPDADAAEPDLLQKLSDLSMSLQIDLPQFDDVCNQLEEALDPEADETPSVESELEGALDVQFELLEVHKKICAKIRQLTTKSNNTSQQSTAPPASPSTTDAVKQVIGSLEKQVSSLLMAHNETQAKTNELLGMHVQMSTQSTAAPNVVPSM